MNVTETSVPIDQRLGITVRVRVRVRVRGVDYFLTFYPIFYTTQ